MSPESSLAPSREPTHCQEESHHLHSMTFVSPSLVTCKQLSFAPSAPYAPRVIFNAEITVEPTTLEK